MNLEELQPKKQDMRVIYYCNSEECRLSTMDNYCTISDNYYNTRSVFSDTAEAHEQNCNYP